MLDVLPMNLLSFCYSIIHTLYVSSHTTYYQYISINDAYANHSLEHPTTMPISSTRCSLSLICVICNV